MLDTSRTVTLECKHCGSRYEEDARDSQNPYLQKVHEKNSVARLGPTCRKRAFIKGGRLAGRIVSVKPRRRSEPDVILDFADVGLVIVAVKYRSGNDQQKCGDKHEKYLSNTDAFAEPELIGRAQLYELARNWRIGVELAEGRPFTFVNLLSIRHPASDRISDRRGGEFAYDLEQGLKKDCHLD